MTAKQKGGKKSAREISHRFGFGFESVSRFVVRKSKALSSRLHDTRHTHTTSNRIEWERERETKTLLLLLLLLLKSLSSFVPWKSTRITKTTSLIINFSFWTWLRSPTFSSRSWDPSSTLFPPPRTLSSSSCRCALFFFNFSLPCFLIRFDPVPKFCAFFMQYLNFLFCFVLGLVIMSVTFCLWCVGGGGS